LYRKAEYFAMDFRFCVNVCMAGRDTVWHVGNGRICGRAGMEDWQLRSLDRIENVGFILVRHTAFGMTPVLSKAGGQCGCFGMEQVFCELRCRRM